MLHLIIESTDTYFVVKLSNMNLYLKTNFGVHFLILAVCFFVTLTVATRSIGGCTGKGSLGTSQNDKCTPLPPCPSKEALIIINSSPHRADVLINSQKRGITPVKIKLKPDEMNVPLEITITKEGYEAINKKVNIRPCESRMIRDIHLKHEQKHPLLK